MKYILQLKDGDDRDCLLMTFNHYDVNNDKDIYGWIFSDKEYATTFLTKQSIIYILKELKIDQDEWKIIKIN